MKDKLIDFQIFLNDKGLINNHDWDFEKDISSSPRIEVHGYNFCGSWGFDKKGYILKGITWQDKKGNVISNEDFFSLALTS